MSALRRPRLRTRRLPSIFALAPVLLLGCVAEELADLRSQVDRLSACQQCSQSQLTQGLALALCSPPVRQLIDDVGQVCRREDVCLDQKITTLVGDADPTHTGRFITLMKDQRRAALYFSVRDALVGGNDGLYTQRLKRLVFPQPPWLPTTRFLVVSNIKPTPLPTGSPAAGIDSGKLQTSDPAVKRAESRGQQVIERILDFNFPGDQRVSRNQILHWVYAFSRKKDEVLRTEDTPLPGTDLSQSVWVFRIDCATPDSAVAESAFCQQCLPLTPAASAIATPAANGATVPSTAAPPPSATP